ncbi:MAG TPA: Ig-like domain-containing protein [Longimicrobiales bacterium]
MRKWCMLAVVALLGACGDTTDPFGNDISIHLTADSVVLAPGETQHVSVIVTGTTDHVSLTSLDTAIATIDSAGTVTAKTPGTTYIVAAVRTLRDSAKVIVRTTGPAPIPRLGSGLVTERYTGEVAAAGGWAYTTTWSQRFVAGASNSGNAVKIWDVSGPAPVLKDSLIVAGAGTTGDVQISDDGKLLAVAIEGSSLGNGFALYDRTDPGKPTLVKQYVSSATQPGVHTLKFGRVNNTLYLFLAIDPPPALVALDLTTPANPVEVLNRSMGNPFLHDVFVRAGVLFVALWDGGMSILDLGGAARGGSPANPVLLGNVKTHSCEACGGATTSSVHNIWWFHDPASGSKRYAFVGEEVPGLIGAQSRGDIHVVDVSDFSNPREVAFYDVDSTTTSNGRYAGTHNFDVDEASGVLYAAYYNGGVRALDIRGDLSSCSAAQKSGDGRCNLRLMRRELAQGLNDIGSTYIWGVRLVGNFLYASDMLNGLHKLDISALKR